MAQLDITIADAELVRIFDSLRPSQDLYVQLVCNYEDGTEKNVGRSEVCKNAAHKPVWNERFLCARGGGQSLKFKVFVDHTWRMATLCGEAEFDLNKLWAEATVKRKKVQIPLYKKSEQTGVLNVSIRLQEPEGSTVSGASTREAPRPQERPQPAQPERPQPAPMQRPVPQDDRRYADAGGRGQGGQPVAAPYIPGDDRRQLQPGQPVVASQSSPPAGDDRRQRQPGHDRVGHTSQPLPAPQAGGYPGAQPRQAPGGYDYRDPRAAAASPQQGYQGQDRRVPQAGADLTDPRAAAALQQQGYQGQERRVPQAGAAPRPAPQAQPAAQGARVPQAHQRPQQQQQPQQPRYPQPDPRDPQRDARTADRRPPAAAAPAPAARPPAGVPPTAAPQAQGQPPPGPAQNGIGQSGQWWESFINRG